MSRGYWVLPILGRLVVCLIATWACHYVFAYAMGKATQPQYVWALTIVVSSVVWVWMFIKPAARLLGFIFDAMRAHLWREENGRYYAFEGQRVRLVLIDGEPWVVEEDIVRIAGKDALRRTHWQHFPPEDFRPVPGTSLKAFSEAGVQKLFAGRTDHHLNRIGLWLEREVFFPFRRARERGVAQPDL